MTMKTEIEKENFQAEKDNKLERENNYGKERKRYKRQTDRHNERMTDRLKQLYQRKERIKSSVVWLVATSVFKILKN